MSLGMKSSHCTTTMMTAQSPSLSLQTMRQRLRSTTTRPLVDTLLCSHQRPRLPVHLDLGLRACRHGFSIIFMPGMALSDSTLSKPFYSSTWKKSCALLLVSSSGMLHPARCDQHLHRRALFGLVPYCQSTSHVAGSASCFTRFVVSPSRLLRAWRVPHLFRIASLGSAAVSVPCRIDCVHLCLAHSSLRSVPRLVFVLYAHDFVDVPARITFSCLAALSISQNKTGGPARCCTLHLLCWCSPCCKAEDRSQLCRLVLREPKEESPSTPLYL